jgi:hypothetical protein
VRQETIGDQPPHEPQKIGDNERRVMILEHACPPV